MKMAICGDDVLRKAYARSTYTVDEIVSDPEILAKFVDEGNKELPKADQLRSKDLCKRLFNLRKRGEDNGGLVRKYRQFNGRSNKPK